MRFLKNEDTNTSTDTLDGMQSSYPGLFIHSSKGIVLLNRERSHRVALMSGGGAGHEPFGAGFVGENMLTGFVYGPIFDSPPIGSITTAIQHLAKWNEGGIIVFILNTPSNRMTFGLAVERAKMHGIKINSTYIADDCSLVGSNGVQHENISQRKTLSGAVMFFKILGGLATSGAGMDEILWENKLLTSRTASLSVVYGPCKLPGKVKPQFRLKKNQISVGCGPNGEEGGIYTTKICPIEEVVHLSIGRLLPRCLIYERGSACVLINGLGSLTTMAAYIIANEVHKALVSKNVTVVRMYTGKMMTSLDAKGFHITITNVTDKESWVSLLDLETEAFAWPGTKLSRMNPNSPQREVTMDIQDVTEIAGKELDVFDANILKNCLQAVCKALIGHRDELNYLCSDSKVELGTEMNRFAESTLEEIKRSSTFLMSLPNTFLKLAKLSEETMNTSAAGSIYGLLFMGAAKSSDRPWPEIWDSAVATLSKYSSAKIGHRSLIDSLVPACGVFRRIIARDGQQAWKHALKSAVDTAEDACAETATMISKSIKSPFYGESKDDIEAGARAVVIVLQAIYNELNKPTTFTEGPKKGKKM